VGSVIGSANGYAEYDADYDADYDQPFIVRNLYWRQGSVNVRMGLTAEVRCLLGQRPLSDPKAAIASGSNERPLMADSCPSPASQ